MTPTDYRVLLLFDTDEPEFTRGFEAGRLWERLKHDHTDWSELIHASNAEMAIRMCEAQQRSFRAETLDDIWMELHVS